MEDIKTPKGFYYLGWNGWRFRYDPAPIRYLLGNDVKNVSKKERLLLNRVLELTRAIEKHRDQKADDRCIEDDDALYAVLGDGIKCDRSVGSKEDMLKNCQRFIENRCTGGTWPTYADLEDKIENLQYIIEEAKDAANNLVTTLEV